MTRESPAPRRLAGAIAIAGALFPFAGSALSLQEAAISSRLSEPLKMRIPIEVSTAYLDDVVVRLPPSAQYAAMGIPAPDPLLQQLTVQLVQDEAGLWAELETRERVNEPLFSLLVELNHGNARVIREYTVMLDFPSPTLAEAPLAERPQHTARLRLAPSEAAAPAPTAAPRALESMTTAAAAPIPPVETALTETPPAALPPHGRLDGDRYGPIRPGETLSEIALRVRQTPAIGVVAMTQALLSANPQAFPTGRPESLRVGSWLQIPEVLPGTAPVATPHDLRVLAETPSAPPSETRTPATAAAASATLASLQTLGSRLKLSTSLAILPTATAATPERSAWTADADLTTAPASAAAPAPETGLTEVDDPLAETDTVPLAASLPADAVQATLLNPGFSEDGGIRRPAEVQQLGDDAMSREVASARWRWLLAGLLAVGLGVWLRQASRREKPAASLPPLNPPNAAPEPVLTSRRDPLPPSTRATVSVLSTPMPAPAASAKRPSAPADLLARINRFRASATEGTGKRSLTLVEAYLDMGNELGARRLMDELERTQGQTRAVR